MKISIVGFAGAMKTPLRTPSSSPVLVRDPWA